MFERYEGGDQAILVHVLFSQEHSAEDLEEFRSLALAAGAEILHILQGNRKTPHPKYFIGAGKAEELAEYVKSLDATVVLFNHSLSPAQARNLEKLCHCRVVDRTGLILDIFAQRARTYEGKLQVELAQLRHLSTRLIRGWTHLERQKGGIGLRGPGETQLESDRRMIKVKIKQILLRLEKVTKQRIQNQRARNRAEVATVSLVGYTNAGKSTLFNELAKSEVYVADKLFATLDPTLRKIEIPDVGDAVLIDTVGFIRHLPHELVAAFKSTLEETKQAILLLHVIDVSDKRIYDNIESVDRVLDEIEADNIPRLLVMNKIDQVEECLPRIDRNENDVPVRVWVSAETGAGIDLLVHALSERLSREFVRYQLSLPLSEGRLRSRFYQLHAIEDEQLNEEKINLFIKLPIKDWNRLCKQEPDLVGYIV